MDTNLILAISTVVIIVLILCEMPIGLALGTGATVGIALMYDIETATQVLATVPFSTISIYALFAIPMFVLLGSLVANTKIAESLFDAAQFVFGRLPGGLAASTVGATMVFSGISGSSSADVATVGRISISQMRKHGYSGEYSAAIVATAGAFAALIPPSVGLVLYAVLSGESVGAMILAGIVPGIISGVVLGVAVVCAAVVRNRRVGSTEGVSAIVQSSRPTTSTGTVALAGPTHTGRGGRVPAAVGAIYGLVLFCIVAGGIYAGIFTPTEAGAFGAFASLILVVISVRFRVATVFEVSKTALWEAAQLTAMIFLLVIGGALLSYMVAASGLPADLAIWLVGLDLEPRVIIALILILMIPLGMVLDGLSIMLLTVPIIVPIVDVFGFNGIWFGILMIKLIEIGLLTPPVGLNVFVAAGLFPDLKIEKIFRAVAPFILLDLAITSVFFIFPDIILWLPSRAGF